MTSRKPSSSKCRPTSATGRPAQTRAMEIRNSFRYQKMRQIHKIFSDSTNHRFSLNCWDRLLTVFLMYFFDQTISKKCQYLGLKVSVLLYEKFVFFIFRTRSRSRALQASRSPASLTGPVMTPKTVLNRFDLLHVFTEYRLGKRTKVIEVVAE